MYFKSLTITNLYSYYGSITFDLTLDPDPTRNIVIIKGRNGDGKTSFLNSLKLLFAGVTEDIRRTAQRRRLPSPKQYICGIQNDWWGIYNQQARQQSLNQDDLTCSVQAIWDSDEGEVKAVRSWKIDAVRNDYIEKVTVSSELQGMLTDKEADDYLERCLPKSYMPFFFFDGEEVQALAEANNNEIIGKMELLLNIRPLENMQDRLKDLAYIWKKGAMSAEKRQDLTDKENAKRAKETELAGIEEKMDFFKTDIDDIEEKLEKIARQQRILRGNDQENESAIKVRKKLKDERHQQLGFEICESFQRDAFLSLTPELVEKALQTTDILRKQEHGSQREMLDSLKKELPNLFTRPPYSSPKLEPQQVKFYQERIKRELDCYDMPEGNSAVFSLDGHRLKQLAGLLASYQKIHKPHKGLQDKLSECFGLKQEIKKLDFQLKDASDLSDKQRTEYNRLLDAEERHKEELLTLKDKCRELGYKKGIIEESLTSINKDIEKLDKEVREASDLDQKSKFADRLHDALKEVKKRLKQQKRAELEESYNLHLKQLLDSNSLIDRIKISEHFEISYLDERQNLIGMGSVSAGMKQLSVTALLWGLKEVSARDLPLVIDTPMGRIDRQHQHNLLQKYYPKVGRQVILLPTDSELDEPKYALLKPYVYREYHLSNETGKQTHVERIL